MADPKTVRVSHRPAMLPGKAMARNHLLDGMRGVAALLVLVYHAGDFFAAGWVPSGYLAVDFFFALSGLVIAGTYDDRLRAGLSLGAFVRARIVRLYPAFAAALPLGVILAVIKWRVGLLAASPEALGASLLLNAALLPSVLWRVELFVVDAPAWSLFMELIVNFCYAAIGFRRSSRVLLAGVFALMVVVAAGIVTRGSVIFGATWAGAGMGLARAALSFSVGALVARACHGVVPRPLRLAVVAVALLVLALFIPDTPWRVVTDLTFVFIATPLAIALCSGIDVPPRLQGMCLRVGALSYPLYIAHFSILRVFFIVGARLHLAPKPVAVAAICVSIAAAAAISRWVEPFGRRLLESNLVPFRSSRRSAQGGKMPTDVPDAPDATAV